MKTPTTQEDVKLGKEIKRFMWSQAFHELYPLAVGSAALVLSSYSNQAVPTLVGKLLDPASSRHTTKGSSFTANIVWVGFVGGAASFLRTLMLNQAKENMAARIRKAAFASLMISHDLEWFQLDDGSEIKSESLELDAKEHSKPVMPSTTPSTSLGMTPSAIAFIMKDDVDAVADTMTTTLANLVRSSSSVIFSSVNMFLLNPSLFGLSLAVAPAVGSIALITRKYIKKIVRIQQEAGMNAASFLEERLNHIAMVKMSNRENDEVESYNRMQDQLLELGTRSAFANGLSMGTMFFLSTGSLCSILLTGGKAVEAKIMDHGQLVSFGTYSFLLALGSAGVVKALGEFQQGRQAAARVYRLIGQVEESGIEEKDAIVPTTSVVHFSSARHLKVNNLYFAYQNDPTIEILQDVSLTLSRGEVVAMVGKNGAGKSTVAMILAGMYKPKSGSILVEHDNATSVERNRCDYVRDLQRVEQSKLVQVVPQHPAIFGATILDNVRYARPEASEQEVVEALKAANAEQFVSTLEGGLMYQVGRNGSRLSGGQRQRLGLARALLANPVFLILDEPTSSLDSEGESAVADAVTACRESDRSLLVITHRAKTVTLADRIVVLKEGRIAEQGTFLKLQQQQGELFKLMPDLL